MAGNGFVDPRYEIECMERSSLEIRIWGMPMTSEEEKMKKDIFEGMSPRRQQRILKKGYDKWDPFLAPKEPPFFNQEERIRVQEASMRLEEFLVNQSREEGRDGTLHSAYVQGAREICFGLSKGEERYQGMQDFCLWLTKMGDRG
jgi:hypothetical protein